jgi:hypothetical protein
MRSFDGINCKAAFLDLISHILNICFTNARYWGGTVHGSGASQSNVFANLPIFNMTDPISFEGMYDAALQSITDIGAAFNNGSPINGIGDLINAAKNLAKGAAMTGIGGLLNKMGRPQKAGLNALVNFSPTGVWHLTIGNPRHPIMSMGNMKMDDCEIQHVGPLGLDDFPTGLRVVVTLSHAQPRDNLKIEQMYMMGDNRIYQAFGNRMIDIWDSLEEIQEIGETRTSKETAATTATSDTKTETAEDSSIVAGNAAASSNRFYKFFGTTQKSDIRGAAEETHLGSQKKTKSSTDKK